MNSIHSSAFAARFAPCALRFLALRVAFALALCPGAASATAASGSAFRPLGFAEATETAAREQRFILLDFYTTWCGPCRLLDETTWQDAKVVARLAATAVAIKIDAEKERTLAKRFKVDAYPTILVLAADGTERDRYVGYLAPAAFLAKYEATLAGRSVESEASAKVRSSGGKDPKARLELARALAKKPDRSAEALEHFLWLYDEGFATDARSAGQRNRLPSMIASLGKNHPPALEALRMRRAAVWAALAAAGERMGKEQAAQLGHLDAALRDEGLIGEALATIKPGTPVFRAYGEPMQNRLVDMKRYVEALAASDVESDLGKIEELIRGMEASGRATPAQVADIKHKVAIEGALPLEMLAGAGQTDRARRLARKLLAWDNSAAVREALAKRLQRAGATELAAEVGAMTK